MPDKEPKQGKGQSNAKSSSAKSPTGDVEKTPQPAANLDSLVQGAIFDPRPPTPHSVKQLQRTVGNHAVGRLLSQPSGQVTVQRKSGVGSATSRLSLTPSAPRIQRNEESAGLLTKLAMPQTFEGPAVEVQKELVERLEKEFEKIDKKELVNFNPSCLGGIVLVPPKEGELSLEGLMESAKLIDLPPEKSEDPRSRAVGKSTFELAQAAGVEKHIIINTLATMAKAGQIDYLVKSGLLKDPGWEILVEIHYYRDRSSSQTRLHKDTLGQTLFVNLNYVNDNPIQGPEFIMNPDLGGKTMNKTYLEYMQQKLPPEFIKDIEEVKTYYGEPTEIGMSEIPAHGVVSFVDEAMHHKTPTMGHRQANGGAIARALTKKYPEEFERARKAYESHKGQTLTWWGYASYLKDPKQATAEEWYKLIHAIQDKEKEFDRTEIAAILPRPDFLNIDELIEEGGFVDFGQANILYAKRLNVAVKKEGKAPLTRQMSQKMLKGYKPLVSTGPRKFFRTWVRAIKKG